MTRVARALLLFAGTLVLAGCQSANLISMDNEWRQTYSAMQNPDFLISGSNYDAQLADLSDRAQAAGARAASSEPQTAISFYRLAALAAWKAGEIRESEVVGISEAGNALCSRLPNGIASQPRDCGILLVTPAFALHDREARLYERLLSAAPSPPGRQLTPEELNSAKAAIEQLRGAFNDVAAARDRVAPLRLPANFNSGFLDSNWLGVYCTARGIYGLVLRNEANEQMLLGSMRTMEMKLRDSSIQPTCASAG